MSNTAFVNQALICSWNQPVLSNEGILLLNETTGEIGGISLYRNWCKRENVHCSLCLLCL